MTIRQQVTLSQLQKILKPLGYHAELSWEETLEYWCEKILIRHFQRGNVTSYGYKRLDPEYAQRKRRMYGNQPILVASGKLREDVTSKYKIYKIKGKFRVILDVPEYGRYVKEIRDYTIVNKRDRRDLMRYWKLNLTNRRKRFVSQITIRRR